MPTDITDLKSQAAQERSALVNIEAERAIQEVQAAMTIAKRFPRDPVTALDRIEVACGDKSLAEQAMYSYARGGQEITGETIRLVEAVAQNWGNLQFGIRELSQSGGESTIEAFAWDLETNTRQVKVFQVPHVRYSRGGVTKLEDPRDIYETIANMGARRLRSCITGIIPGGVIERAKEYCANTLKSTADTSPDGQKKLVEAFAKFGITKEQIETRIQRRLDAIAPPLVVSLQKIWVSLRDGMSKPEDWFETKKDISDLKTQGTGESGAQNKEDNGEAAKPTYPKKFTDNETGEEGWEDSSGAFFDQQKHAMARNGVPTVKANGEFRARRNVRREERQQEPSNPDPAREQTSGPDPAREQTSGPDDTGEQEEQGNPFGNLE